MKNLALALVLLATTSHAGGLFNDATTTPASAGASQTTLYSTNIGAGSVTNGNAIRVRMDMTADSLGVWCDLAIKLNGVTVWWADCRWFSTARVDLEIWREGSTGATVVGTGFTDFQWCNFQPDTLTGFAWGSVQTLTITGSTDDELTLDRVGVER